MVFAILHTIIQTVHQRLTKNNFNFHDFIEKIENSKIHNLEILMKYNSIYVLYVYFYTKIKY